MVLLRGPSFHEVVSCTLFTTQFQGDLKRPHSSQWLHAIFIYCTLRLHFDSYNGEKFGDRRSSIRESGFSISRQRYSLPPPGLLQSLPPAAGTPNNFSPAIRTFSALAARHGTTQSSITRLTYVNGHSYPPPGRPRSIHAVGFICPWTIRFN